MMGTIQTITNSRATAFKTCRRRHWYSYEMALRPEVDAKALRMGTAFHYALDALKQNGSEDQARADINLSYANCPDYVDQLAWDYELYTILSLFNGYVWRWPAPWKSAASEQSFYLPIRNPQTSSRSLIFQLGGKIDGIVELEDGRLAVLEHKTTSEDLAPDSDYWRRLQIDQQISIYVLAARELGYDVSTVLYDVIRKPTIKPTAVPVLDAEGLKIVLAPDGSRVSVHNGRPRQTADKARGFVLQTREMSAVEWGEKLVADIGERPEFYYARMEIARLDSEIEEVRQELWDLQKSLRDAQLHMRHYRTVSRDTCPFCPYWRICSAKIDLDPSAPPEGFHYVSDLHEELQPQEV